MTIPVLFSSFVAGGTTTLEPTPIVVRPRAVWALQLCDHSGTALCELTTASGIQIAYTRNSYAEAQFTLSHEDNAASLLLTELASGIPQLKAWRRGPNDSAGALRFRGWLAPFSEEAEESALLSLVFRSPFARLTGDGSDRGRFTGEVQEYFATDAGAIAKSLIDLANAQGDTGLSTTGTVQATMTRDRTYQYANIGESVVALTNVIDGFDFSETFLNTTALAEFNVWASLGDDKPGARFEYGETTLNNVRRMSRTTQQPINSVTVLGANGLIGSDSDAASIAKYGLWPLQASASDVTIQSTLDEKASALLRPNPVKTVDFGPEYALSSCPVPFDDFWIGDTVRLFARRAALTEDVAVRVNSMTITVDDNGYEVAEIPDPLTPDEESSIRANLSLEVVDG